MWTIIEVFKGELRLPDLCRRLVCAAALIATLGVARAQAQTVIVQHAAVGSTVDVVFNTDVVGTAKVAADQSATSVVDALAKREVSRTSVYVFVETCPNVTRVLLVEAGLPPPQGEGCGRKQIAGLFSLSKVTTLVIDVGAAAPALWLRQGPPPASWLADTAAGVAVEKSVDAPPANVVLFAGGSLMRFSNATASVCGSLSSCTADDARLGYRAGAAFWIKPFLGLEASYLRPKRMKANGTGTGFHFDATREAELATVAGVFGVPLGRARLYGQAGANYHRATTTTNETIDASGSQTIVLETAGWGWLFGGGGEVWITRRLGLYAELNLARVKGKARHGGQGVMDDHALFVVVGARLHIGR